MSKRQDLTGQVFGDLEVIEFAGVKDTQAKWKVKCKKCSNTSIVMASNLKSGNTKACNKCRVKKLKDRKKLSEEQVKYVKKMNSLGVSMRTLAKDLGVGVKAIFNAAHE